MNSYFAVICKCGHVGRNNYILITFPVIANNKKDAARIARNIPRCKHHHKDCIREVANISYEDFLRIEQKNNKDPYLKCKCIQDQRNVDISSRVECEQSKHFKKTKEKTIRDLFNGKTKIKHPKKYFRFVEPRVKTFDLRDLGC